jgi:hypothetical protein
LFETTFDKAHFKAYIKNRFKNPLGELRMFNKIKPLSIYSAPQGVSFGYIDSGMGSINYCVIFLESFMKHSRLVSKHVYCQISIPEMNKILQNSNVVPVLERRSLNIVEMDQDQVIWKDYKVQNENTLKEYEKRFEEIRNYKEIYNNKVLARQGK